MGSALAPDLKPRRINPEASENKKGQSHYPSPHFWRPCLVPHNRHRYDFKRQIRSADQPNESLEIQQKCQGYLAFSWTYVSGISKSECARRKVPRRVCYSDSKGPLDDDKYFASFSKFSVDKL